MFSHARLRTRKILKHDLLFAARDVQLYSTQKMRSTLNISEICSPKNSQFWMFRFRWVLLIYKGPFWSSERYIFNSVINKNTKKKPYVVHDFKCAISPVCLFQR